MNKRLATLEERQKEIVKHSSEILDAASDADRDLTKTEESILDRNKVEIADIKAKIAQEHLDAPNISNPTVDSIGDTFGRAGWSDTRGNTVDTSPVKGRIGARYSELFRGDGGHICEEEFFGALKSGTFHPQLNALNEGSGSSGGYVVPTPTASRYLEIAYENSIVWPRCTVYPMTSETLKVPGFDVSTAASGVLYGGMTWQWLPEEGTGTVTNPTYRKIELHARKLAIFATASNEVSDDGINLASQLENAMTKGAAWAMDYSLLAGTGAGEPLGVLNAPSKVTVSKEAVQAADTILYENCIKMLARLHPSCFKNAVWLANPTCIPQLLQMNVVIGIGGQVVPVLRESDKSWLLLTLPIIFTEKVPALGDLGDIVLVDLSQYIVGMRKELTIERSQHVNFMSDLTTWRGILRVDGQDSWNTFYTPHTGDTQSWIVDLEAR